MPADTTHQVALQWLRRAIVEGELRAGERVRQEDVAERIGVSVVPVREALRALEGEGQVTYRPRRGYFVTELDLDDLVEIYGLRKLLETRAAALAVTELNQESVARIRQAAAEYEAVIEADDVSAGLFANRVFHFAVLEAGYQPHTMRLIRMLWDSTDPYRALYADIRKERVAAVRAHQEIIEALVGGEAEHLIELLDAHRERALEVLRGILGDAKSGPEGDGNASLGVAAR